jgi:hypothetical protein
MSKFAEEKKTALEAIDSRIAEVEKTAQNSLETIRSKIDVIQEQINAERAKITEIDEVLFKGAMAEKQLNRIAELEADEKRLAKEYAELEKTSFLIDEFLKFKITLLSDKINGLFKFAKFKLFDMQINGGMAECCEVCYKGVSYSDLNNAAKINIGIDILNTLCKVNNKFAPVFIDNSESVTDILYTDSQMVRLVVSAEDDALRVEKVV